MVQGSDEIYEAMLKAVNEWLVKNPDTTRIDLAKAIAEKSSGSPEYIRQVIKGTGKRKASAKLQNAILETIGTTHLELMAKTGVLPTNNAIYKQNEILKENIDHLKQNLEDKASIAQSYKELYERASRDYAAVYRKNIELESRLTEDLEKNRKKFEEYLAQTKDLQTENFMLRDMNSKLRTEIEELKKEITELKKSLNVA